MKREKIMNYLINNAGTESHLSEKNKTEPYFIEKITSIWVKTLNK